MANETPPTEAGSQTVGKRAHREKHRRSRQGRRGHASCIILAVSLDLATCVALLFISSCPSDAQPSRGSTRPNPRRDDACRGAKRTPGQDVAQPVVVGAEQIPRPPR